MAAHREPVRLNIYDIWWGNNCCSCLGLGAYHSGVEIFGIEFYYAGHPNEGTGIFALDPREYETLGENISYKTSIEMGHTSLTPVEAYHIMKPLEDVYKGRHYHFLNKNCNHFAFELTKLLCGKEVPGWVNRLARLATYVPFLEKSVLTAGENADLQQRRTGHPASNGIPEENNTR